MELQKPPYTIQNLALLPISKSYPAAELVDILMRQSDDVVETLYQCIRQNMLGPVWIEHIGSKAIKKIWDDKRAQDLSDQYRQFAFLYFQQLIAIKKLTRLFDHHNVPNVVFKGAHTRELVYEHPVSRYCCDVDILISENDKNRVLALLIENGYTLHEDTRNLTHEVSLIGNNVSIDLHWHIMRPGRIPLEFAHTFLANRRKEKDYWAPSNEDNLFILLVHHVFTKYPTITQGGLIRMVDLAFWLEKATINWEVLLFKLRQAGVSAAAWISCEYLEALSGIHFPKEFKEKIAPSKARQWYLRQWIRRELPSKFPNHAFVPKIFFTLAGHDSLRDAGKFYITMKRSEAAIKK